jgi:hypothetical protein
MLRGSLALIALCVAAVLAAADDNKVRAKAALALRAEVQAKVSAKGLATPLHRDAACDGTCCDDVYKKLAKALADPDPKPFVIWVGVAPTPETLRALAGYVHCRVETYDGDREGDRPRVLVNLAKKGEYYRVASLAVTVKAEDVKAAVKKGLP